MSPPSPRTTHQSESDPYRNMPKSASSSSSWRQSSSGGILSPRDSVASFPGALHHPYRHSSQSHHRPPSSFRSKSPRDHSVYSPPPTDDGHLHHHGSPNSSCTYPPHQVVSEDQKSGYNHDPTMPPQTKPSPIGIKVTHLPPSLAALAISGPIDQAGIPRRENMWPSLSLGAAPASPAEPPDVRDAGDKYGGDYREREGERYGREEDHEKWRDDRDSDIDMSSTRASPSPPPLPPPDQLSNKVPARLPSSPSLQAVPIQWGDEGSFSRLPHFGDLFH